MSALRVGQLAWLALALLQVLWHGWLRAPPPGLLPVVLVLAWLPLALPLLARSAARRLWWAAVAALLYFSHGVMVAWAMHGLPRVLGWAELLLALLLIGATGAAGRRAR
jgi:uncharacterized membrane protein